MPDGYLLCDDLIFASKVTATARAHGLTVTVAKTPEKLLEWLAAAPAAVVADLHVAGLDVAAVVAAAGSCPVVGFGSHVDAERLRAARAVGCTLVLPRSAFVARLEAELPAWLAQVRSGADQGQ